MVNSVPGHKNPVGASVYGSIAGDAWYRAQYLLQDQKLGHYMHIPPKAVFFSQMFGSLVGVPINYAVIRWVLNNKMGYLDGTEIDPNHQWTGQDLAGSLTMGVQYVLVVRFSLSYLNFLTNKYPGPSRTLPAADIPSSPIRLPLGRRHTRRPVPPLPPLPNAPIPPVELHHLLLRPLEFLRQHQHRLPVVHHRRVRRHVLGVSPPLRDLGPLQLHPRRGV
jgi:hypothetical protein